MSLPLIKHFQRTLKQRWNRPARMLNPVDIRSESQLFFMSSCVNLMLHPNELMCSMKASQLASTYLSP